MVKRAESSAHQKREQETKAQERKRIIDFYYAHCKYCNFFFEKSHPDQTVCSSPFCKQKEIEEVNF